MNNDNRTSYFVMIPYFIHSSEELTMSQKHLYGTINNYSNMELGYCFTTNGTLAKEEGVAERTITHNLRVLKDYGLIRIITIQKGQLTQRRMFPIDKFAEYEYMLNNLPDDEIIIRNEVKPISLKGWQKIAIPTENAVKLQGGVANGCYGGVAKNCYHNNKTLNNNTLIKDIKKKEVVVYYENEELQNIFIEFLELRTKLKAVNSERAINGLLNKLEPHSDKVKIKMIEQSIISSWKSIYDLKNDYNKNDNKVRQGETNKMTDDYWLQYETE